MNVRAFGLIFLLAISIKFRVVEFFNVECFLSRNFYSRDDYSNKLFIRRDGLLYVNFAIKALEGVCLLEFGNVYIKEV